MAPLSERSKADTVATDIPSDKGYLKIKLTYFISSLSRKNVKKTHFKIPFARLHLTGNEC